MEFGERPNRVMDILIEKPWAFMGPIVELHEIGSVKIGLWINFNVTKLGDGISRFGL